MQRAAAFWGEKWKGQVLGKRPIKKKNKPEENPLEKDKIVNSAPEKRAEKKKKSGSELARASLNGRRKKGVRAARGAALLTMRQTET